MADNTPVPVHSIDRFTKSEIADAYELLVQHQEEYLSLTPQGACLRMQELTHFEHCHPDCDSIEQLAIHADLEGNVDVKNALTIKLNAQQYADNALR